MISCVVSAAPPSLLALEKRNRHKSHTGQTDDVRMRGFTFPAVESFGLCTVEGQIRKGKSRPKWRELKLSFGPHSYGMHRRR